MHWDDDDVSHADRVVEQVGPILRGEAEFTTLLRSWLVRLDLEGGAVTWFDYQYSRRGRWDNVPSQLSTLTYRRSLGMLNPFADTSLGEDLNFSERLVVGCHSHASLPLPFGYVRHDHNSWKKLGASSHGRWNQILSNMSYVVGAKETPAGLAGSELEADILAAAKDAHMRGACERVHDFEPAVAGPASKHRQSFPHLPEACCVGAETSKKAGCWGSSKALQTNEMLGLQMYLPELRDALKARGLDTTGTKMKMVERLTKATAGNASAHGIRHGRLSVQAACDFCRREVEEVRHVSRTWQTSVARGKPLTLQRAAAIRCRPRALSARADKAVSLTGRLEPPCDHCPVCNSLEPAPSRGRGARAAAPRAAAARAAAARAAAARAAGRGRGREQGRGETRG